MSKSQKALQAMPAPARRAMVFVCQKCGKRIGDSAKHASYALASQIKRAAKKEFGKGEVRVALSSCMDLCPKNGIAMSLQPLAGPLAPLFMEADIDDLEAAGEALLARIRRSQDG